MVVDMYDSSGIGGRFKGFAGARPEPKNIDIKTKPFYVYKKKEKWENI
ncbi:MAG: hypothetical protein ACRDDY_03440 [Clostridium sp.]